MNIKTVRIIQNRQVAAFEEKGYQENFFVLLNLDMNTRFEIA